MKTGREFRIKARISDGRIVFESHYDAKMILDNFEGEEILVSVEKFKDKRSLAANAYYWGVVIPSVQDYIYDSAGEKYDKDDIHSFHLSSIAGISVETKEFLGELIMSVKGKSTSDMSVEEFTDYIRKIQLYWSERGLYIADPKEKDLLNINPSSNG